MQFLRFGDTTYLPNRFPVMLDIEKFLLTRLFLCSREAEGWVIFASGDCEGPGNPGGTDKSPRAGLGG